ncbi:copper resistance protein CopC [Leisingera sp. ANG-M1]|uniref:copper resistance CopC family protein n=1 Tax=Leisingera sp. ANG-M1 TaxID=1577895 RepID=UPI00057CC7F0|nr:copper resistance CopC family protein [Leisingera sp. ANG-M1]KIC09044.1 copper resistance protein CopC [Leisingera sp. ANG-M1]
MKLITACLAFSAFASVALAHSQVDTTTPADGAQVAGVPSEITFDFADEIRLTRVEASHQDSAPAVLDLGGQKSFSRSFSFPFQGAGKGTYRIEWRGLGIDGHPMQGEFQFTVE